MIFAQATGPLTVPNPAAEFMIGCAIAIAIMTVVYLASGWLYAREQRRRRSTRGKLGR